MQRYVKKKKLMLIYINAKSYIIKAYRILKQTIVEIFCFFRLDKKLVSLFYGTKILHDSIGSNKILGKYC